MTWNEKDANTMVKQNANTMVKQNARKVRQLTTLQNDQIEMSS